MNVGLVNEYFPPHAPGGAEWSTYYLGRHLVEAGHKVVVITPNYGAPAYEERDGMRVYRFWFPQKLKSGQLVRSSLHSNLIFYLYSVFRIWRVSRRENIQVLHAHGKYSLPGTFVSAKLLRVPSVVTLRDYRSLCDSGGLCLHGEDWRLDECSFLKSLSCLRAFDQKYNVDRGWFCRFKFYVDRLLVKKTDLWLRKWFLKRVDKIITVSEGLRDIYIRARRFSAEKSLTIYNLPPTAVETLVDVDKVRAKYHLGAKKIVLTVGKLSFGKGTDVLIRAAPQVLQSMPDALFVFVGRKNLLITVPEDLRAHIRMLGVLPHSEVMSLYAIADLVTVPSVWPEPLSRVLLEAMSLGRPIVATRVGGTPEVVQHRWNGLLVERGDSAELAKAIIELLQDSGLGEEMGRRGQEKLRQKLDSGKLIQEYTKAYSSAIKVREEDPE